MADKNSKNEMVTPLALVFTWRDWFKVLWELLFAYKMTYTLVPGLYYTGDDYDVSAPLLVTSNYHLTVWSVWRRIKRLKARVLIIDTDGINVWCSSGKGRFNAEEILRQINRYPREIITRDKEITLILPKLALSGVKLADLRKNGINPVIGPVYAGDLPGYLDSQPFRDCKLQRFEFDLGDRSFTLLSTWMQIAVYTAIGALGLGILHLWLHTGIWWQIVPLGLTLSTLYILVFPYLPTKSFVYKGISLFLVTGAIFGTLNYMQHQNRWETWFYLCFMAGFNIFFGLYYTGNSGVSNYSMVKRETVMFLPVVVLLFVAALVLLILKGVMG